MADNISVDCVVIGSGPAGYAAAFRAADLGMSVALVERYATLGGVCLNVGCIPSKALLHVAKVMDDVEDMSSVVKYGKPEIDMPALRAWKDGVIKKLTGGLAMMAKQRKVTVVQGEAHFASSTQLQVKQASSTQTVDFRNCIIAVGSQPVKLPFIPEDPRVIDSTGALQLENVQGKMLVIGGGIIGLEMATVYRALGADVTIVEMQDQIMPGADADIVKPLFKRVSKQYESILLKTGVTQVDAKDDGLYVTFEGDHAPEGPQRFDRILVAVGRRPNGGYISADKAGIQVDERGFIPVDNQMRTNVSHIFAVGDVVGNPMLAHKGAYEGRLAAEVVSGKKHYNDAKCIPSVAYTDPEVSWVGVTETEAKAQGISYRTGVFPWMASGRALATDRTEGLTKIIVDANNRVIGGAIIGINAGELIAEIGLAIEMGADIEDVALTIHPHPTLSESVMLAAEVCEGTVTDLYIPKKKK